MNSRAKQLFSGLAALTFMALCLLHADWAGDYPIGWFLSRIGETILIAGGLTGVITYFWDTGVRK
jgi:hypothetical protein